MDKKVTAVLTVIVIFTACAAFAENPEEAEILREAEFLVKNARCCESSLKTLYEALKNAKGNMREVLECMQVLSASGSNTPIIATLGIEAAKQEKSVRNFDRLLFVASNHTSESARVQAYLEDYVRNGNKFPAFAGFVNGELEYADFVKKTGTNIFTHPDEASLTSARNGMHQDIVGIYLADFASAPKEIREAAQLIASYFKSPDRSYLNLSPLIEILAVLGDSPRNIPVIVELSRYVAFERSAVTFYLELILFASKARYASEEFLRLAESEKRSGSETYQRLLIAATLTAAQSEAECAAIMKERERRFR